VVTSRHPFAQKQIVPHTSCEEGRSFLPYIMTERCHWHDKKDGLMGLPLSSFVQLQNSTAEPNSMNQQMTRPNGQQRKDHIA
jgi:hypothetical protein